MNSTKLKQISACILQAFSCVLARVLASIVARIDLFCNLQKSILQEIFFQNKIILFLCKKIFLGARQATYNHIPLKDYKQ
jgi:hypothetical protein